MGSPERKLKREKAKRQYESFKTAWRDTKRQQQLQKDGLKIDGTELVAPTSNTTSGPVLGKHPTFRMWKEGMSARARQIELATLAAASKEKLAEEVKDLDWEEEKVDQPKAEFTGRFA